MLFRLYGDQSNPAVILLPDACCQWEKLFGQVAEALSADYCVAVAAYDGFDPERPEAAFTDLSDEVSCVVAFANTQLGGKVHGIYGCGFGGKVAVVSAMLLEDVNHVLVDGTDFATRSKMVAKMAARSASKGFYKLFQDGELPADMQKMLAGADEQGRAYLERLFAAYGAGGSDMGFVTLQNLSAIMVADATCDIGREVEVPGVRFHILCPMASGSEYADDARRFPGADVRQNDAYKLELLLCRPQEWLAQVRDCLAEA